MKTLIENLRELLANDSALSYASDSGFVSRDVDKLVKRNKFPFFNVVPGSTRIMRPDGIDLKSLERKVFQVTIQFATCNLEMNVAILGDDNNTGLLDFADDIWTVLKSDKTVSSAVDGMVIYDLEKENEIEIEPFVFPNNDRMVAAAEITLEYYRDAVP